MNFQQLVLASHNAGKLKELQAMLGESVQLRSIGEFSQVEPEETGLSFVENAILKARNAARISGLPALADDSGLAVDALGGAPGIYSARYADGQGDAANNAKLLEALKDVPEAERGAQFVCVLALVRHADDPLPVIPCQCSARGCGTGGFCSRPVASMVSATTRCSGCLNAIAPAPTWRRWKRTNSVTAPGPWPCCVSAWDWHDRILLCATAGPGACGAAAAVAVHPHSLVRAQMPLLRLQLAPGRTDPA